ncbi:MAG: virulence factor [Alphaproteobacteria bacterium]|nr:virulence factor [Alphaproteobacteria bacterium]
MADLITVYWRDIPAQIIVKKGRATAKRELSLRFTEAIDMCAMRTGAHETDDYLAEWRRGTPQKVSDDLEAEADKAVAAIESQYTKDHLKRLVQSEGKAADHDDGGGNANPSTG